MSREILKDRESAFEFEFCHKVDQQLMEDLRQKLRAEDRQMSLSRATGIKTECVLHELDSLELNSESVLALSLYPLVHVAWADGKVDDRERAAVLEAAESAGFAPDSASFRLLKLWLENWPGERVYDAWKHYVAALVGSISTVAGRSLKESLTAKSRRIAEVSGGILGIHKISAAEEAALAELEAVFAASVGKGQVV